jgi:hypothetical protein
MISIIIVLQINSEEDNIYAIAAISFFSLIQICFCGCCWVSSIEYHNNPQYNIESHPIINPLPPANPQAPANQLPVLQIQPLGSIVSENDREIQNSINMAHPNNKECISCLENIRSVKLGCGHLVLCHMCIIKLKRINPICPICRVPITEIKENIFSENDYSPSDTPPPAPDEN